MWFNKQLQIKTPTIKAIFSLIGHLFLLYLSLLHFLHLVSSEHLIIIYTKKIVLEQYFLV